MQVGLKRIVEVARGLGITSPLQAVPALSLGAFEVSPVELATLYATLANGGVRPPVHGVDAVLAQGGSPLTAMPLPEPVVALSPSTVYLVTSVLQGVLNHGTATSVRNSLQDPLAGKTGTTNRRRDSWVARYAPASATPVWVAYQAKPATRLPGDRAAVPTLDQSTAQNLDQLRITHLSCCPAASARPLPQFRPKPFYTR